MGDTAIKKVNIRHWFGQMLFYHRGDRIAHIKPDGFFGLVGVNPDYLMY